MWSKILSFIRIYERKKIEICHRLSKFDRAELVRWFWNVPKFLTTCEQLSEQLTSYGTNSWVLPVLLKLVEVSKTIVIFHPRYVTVCGLNWSVAHMADQSSNIWPNRGCIHWRHYRRCHRRSHRLGRLNLSPEVPGCRLTTASVQVRIFVNFVTIADHSGDPATAIPDWTSGQW